MPLDKIITVITNYVYPGILVVFFFGLTIFIHELGHFLVALWRRMKIERFSVGFGPKIFGWERNGIDYRVSWLPFGGYVALPQMAPMEAIEGKTESKAEDLPAASPASKALVALAGPVMNILLAVLLASLVWVIGLPTPINPSIVGWVDPGSREEQLGIQAGDRIMAVNGEPVKTWMDVNRVVVLSREPNVQVAIKHAGQTQTYLLAADRDPVLGIKTINLYPEGRPVASKVMPHSPAERAGIQAGDEFLAVNGVPVGTRAELIDLIKGKPNQPLQLKIMRDGKVLLLTATPEWEPDLKVARINVELQDKLEYQMVRPGPTPVEQFQKIFKLMGDTFYALYHSKETGVGPRSLSGPVGIVGGWWLEIKSGGLMRGVWFAVLLNLNLAVLNLLPLPILDGGHIVFAALEGIRRKPLNVRLMQNVSMAFFILIITFILYVSFFDVQRFFFLKAPTKSQPTEPPATHQ